MFWLLVFLVMSVIILARQTSAIQHARGLALLREQRTALEAEQAALQRQIHDATSRQVLARIAETELGLHFPVDSELTVLPLRRRVLR
jgi:cell division protein FtsL